MVTAFVTPATITSNNNRIISPIAATAELDGMIGVDIESGKKIVRSMKKVIRFHPKLC
jgi:hypothetical protein